MYKPPSMVGWLGCEVLKIMSSITGSSNQGLYKPPSMLGWLGCEVLKIMSSITGSSNQGLTNWCWLLLL